MLLSRKTLPFLLLLITSTLCSAMIVPFMGYFIVEGLGRAPWAISLYAAMATLLTIGVNRVFSARLDRGQSAFALIGLAGGGYLCATLALSLYPAFATLLSIGVLGFGLSSSATSTLFSLGHGVAETAGLKSQSFNAIMRATTSTAWMMGPALSFFVADQLGPNAVFRVALGLAVVWLLLWPQVIPRAARLPTKDTPADAPAQTPRGLWLAASVCFCLSLGHSLTFTALPLFYVQEVGLPTYAPGTAFSMKTFVEIFAILATPWLIARFGLRALLMCIALLAAGTIQLLARVQSFDQMLLGAALEGLYYGLYASVGLSFIQSFANGRMAHATATYWNTLMISGLIAGPLTGLIAQYYSFGLVVQIASVGGLCGFVLLVLTRRQGQAQAV
ncbi:MFS transporter [Phaeobacter sp. HF9A]|uniref:MFS transporter n=1 Tax=Phaeobacter sp. HF9A TaxID=2721561 RepID=UPI00142FF0A2|nr:MFS transporter [Phaeobacter sp. HF9A]NIZ15422.1 MFS transporter [Phaeobacter sp. HF9A]